MEQYEVQVRNDEGEGFHTETRERRQFRESGRPKNCKIKSYYCGEDDDEPEKMDIDYEKKHWKEGNWSREWKHDDFEVEFKQRGGGYCEVKTKSDDYEPLVTLCYGFLIGF